MEDSVNLFPQSAYRIRSLEEVSLEKIQKVTYDSMGNERTFSYKQVFTGESGIRKGIDGEVEMVCPWESNRYNEISDLTLIPDFSDRAGDYWLAFNAITTDGSKVVNFRDRDYTDKTLSEILAENKYEGEPRPGHILVD